MPQGSLQACAACKFLRKKCSSRCVFAPYFPHDDTRQWYAVHRTFGACNISKLLLQVQPEQRADTTRR